MTQPLTYCEINLQALEHNLALAKQLAGQRQLIAVVKADAYGHGILPVSKQLAPHCNGLAVARLEEALLLRQHLPETRILLLSGPCSADMYETAVSNTIELVVHDPSQLDFLSSRNTDNIPPVIWLKLDTGMHRLGFQPENLTETLHRIKSLCGNAELRLMSHFASSESRSPEVMTRQYEQFRTVTGDLPYPTSLSNSGALLYHSRSIADDWVRPGIMLYGAPPNPLDTPRTLDLKAVMRFYSTVIAVKTLEKGESVGYGGRWTARRKSRLAVIAAGYGDGYPIQAIDGTPVLIQQQRCPIAGRVSMDMLCVDCSDVPAVKPGDRVELWGDNLPVTEVAGFCGAISYALLTGVTSRVKRHYIA